MVDPAVPVYQRKIGHYQEGHVWEGGGQVWVHDGPDVRDNLLKLDLIQIKFLMESVPTSVQLLAKGAENNLWVWVQKG